MTTAYYDRVFDWRPHHDERSRGFGIRAAVPQPRLHNRSWNVPRVPLDQGAEGACVGYAWTHEALATPVAVNLARLAIAPMRDPDQFARETYRAAQRIDPWPGEDYDGTSVLAGAKIMQQRGILKEYRWGFGVEDLVTGLLTTGPAVLGIPWFSGMYYAPRGILTKSGTVVGGHAILAVGYRLAGEVFEEEPAIQLFNSWGPGWGVHGKAFIRQSSLAELLADGGETCIPYRRSYGRQAK